MDAGAVEAATYSAMVAEDWFQNPLKFSLQKSCNSKQNLFSLLYLLTILVSISIFSLHNLSPFSRRTLSDKLTKNT